MKIKSIPVFAIALLAGSFYLGTAFAQTEEKLIPVSQFKQKNFPDHCQLIKVIKRVQCEAEINSLIKQVCPMLTKNMHCDSNRKAALTIGPNTTLLLAENVRITYDDNGNANQAPDETSIGLKLLPNAEVVGLTNGVERAAVEGFDVGILIESARRRGLDASSFAEAESRVAYVDVYDPQVTGIEFAEPKRIGLSWRAINVAIEDVKIRGDVDGEQTLYQADTIGVQFIPEWDGRVYVRDVEARGLGTGFILKADEAQSKLPAYPIQYQLEFEAVRAVQNRIGADFVITSGDSSQNFPPEPDRERVLVISQNSIFDNNLQNGLQLEVDLRDWDKAIDLKDLSAINNGVNGVLFEADNKEEMTDIPPFEVKALSDWHIVAANNGLADVNNQTLQMVTAAYAPKTIGPVDSEMPRP